MSQAHPFVTVRQAEKMKSNADLEFDFQVDSATSISKLSASSLCLSVGTNPRCEGSFLN